MTYIQNRCPIIGTWLVLNMTSGGRPTVEHSSPSAAYTEQERLATAHPGQVFVVVQVNRAVKAVATIKLTGISARGLRLD